MKITNNYNTPSTQEINQENSQPSLLEVINIDELGYIGSEIDIYLNAEKTKAEVSRLKAGLLVHQSVIEQLDLNIAKKNLIDAEIRLEAISEVNDYATVEFNEGNEMNLQEIIKKINEKIQLKISDIDVYNEKKADVDLLVKKIQNGEYLKGIFRQELKQQF